MPWEREFISVNTIVFHQQHDWGFINISYNSYLDVWFGNFKHNGRAYILGEDFMGDSIEVMMHSLEKFMERLGLQ